MRVISGVGQVARKARPTMRSLRSSCASFLFNFPTSFNLLKFNERLGDILAEVSEDVL